VLRHTYTACLLILLLFDSGQVEDILLRLKIRARLLDIPSSVCCGYRGPTPSGLSAQSECNLVLAVFPDALV